ncbi:unnamed protein product [Prunus armeniaca]
MMTRGLEQTVMVSDFLTASGSWNLSLLEQHFSLDDRDVIAGIPLGSVSQRGDSRYWFFSKNEKYRVAVRQCDEDFGVGGSDQRAQEGFWMRIWKLAVPNKIKMLLWRACMYILPTAVNLVKRRVLTSLVCARCGNYSEDAYHALWSCKSSKKFWKCTHFFRRINLVGGTFADAFEAVASRLSKADLERFACCVWSAWKLRNDFLHGKPVTRVDHLVENTLDMMARFKSCEERSKLPLVSPQVRWLKPRVNALLLNCDGAVERGQGDRGLEGCCRDHNGNFICGFAVAGPPSLDVLGTELVAVREGLLMMGYMSFSPFTIGLDSQEAVSILKDERDW